ncbi:hypothetical protein GH733_015279 [Mirounga leonina]|nr:hypothetical protein GH733_015279 [Mirounga leonina]
MDTQGSSCLIHFDRDPQEIEKEEQAAAEKATTEEEFPVVLFAKFQARSRVSEVESYILTKDTITSPPTPILLTQLPNSRDVKDSSAGGFQSAPEGPPLRQGGRAKAAM